MTKFSPSSGTSSCLVCCIWRKLQQQKWHHFTYFFMAHPRKSSRHTNNKLSNLLVLSSINLDMSGKSSAYIVYFVLKLVLVWHHWQPHVVCQFLMHTMFLWQALSCHSFNQQKHRSEYSITSVELFFFSIPLFHCAKSGVLRLVHSFCIW